MRAKDVLAYIPFVTVFCTNLKLIWFRITATRLTTIYFIFSIVNCLVQALLQGEATVVNAKAANYLFDVVKAGNATADGFYVWSHQELRYCGRVPNSVDATRCTLVWKPETASSNSVNGALGISNYSSSTIAATATAFRNPSSALPTSASLKPTAVASTTSASTTSASALPKATSKPTVIVVTPDSDADSNEVLVFSSPAERRSVVGVLEINVNGSVDVVLDGWGLVNTPATLSQLCVDALNWPVQELENTKREDIAFTAFQFWVLSMSLVALLNESIPHIIVSLVTHLSSVAWGAFQLSQTQVFHRKFDSLITDGVCQVNLLPTYWKARSNVEIPSLALNAAALFMSMFLSYRLIKMFGWQTFKRVGASRTIKRVYQLVLVLSVTIQLCLFFVVASVALWLDQICNGAIGRMAAGHKLYEALLAVVLALLPFWLIGGWLAVRRELKTTMTIFLFLSLAYIVGWGAMFDSTTFRWTMSQWSFFAVVMVTAVSLVIVCFVVGIFCRINFNRGLPHYLNAEEPLPGDDFERVTTEKAYGNSDPEKFEFPSAHGPVPTYEAAFGYDDDVPPPPGARTLGPRFYAQDNAPLTVDADQLAGPVDLSNANLPSHAPSHSQSFASTRAPSPVYSRDGSDTTAHSGLPSSVRPLMRHGSSNSQSSFASAKSAASSASQTMRPRWVIE